LAMPVLVRGHDLSCPSRQPDVDVELQRHDDLRDRERRVRGICSSRLAADAGSRQKIGIALCAFPRWKGWHISRWCGWVKRAAGENDGFLLDQYRSFPRLACGWGITRRMAAEENPSQQYARHNDVTHVEYGLRIAFSNRRPPKP
jgi:hypothetical protein